MAFKLKIGTLDATKYVATDGYKWERNDIDSPNSGRDMSGDMHRRVVARKDKLTVTCRQLTSNELQKLINALDATTISVTYTIPGSSERSSLFYNSKRSAGIVQDVGSELLYKDVSFDLIEV